MSFESTLRCDDCGRSLEQVGTCPAWCSRTVQAYHAHYELVKSVGAAFVAKHNTFFAQDVASTMDTLGNVGLALEQDAYDQADAEDASRVDDELVELRCLRDAVGNFFYSPDGAAYERLERAFERVQSCGE